MGITGKDEPGTCARAHRCVVDVIRLLARSAVIHVACSNPWIKKQKKKLIIDTPSILYSYVYHDNATLIIVCKDRFNFSIKLNDQRTVVRVSYTL